MVKLREQKKRNLLQTTIKILETRYEIFIHHFSPLNIDSHLAYHIWIECKRYRNLVQLMCFVLF